MKRMRAIGVGALLTSVALLVGCSHQRNADMDSASSRSHHSTPKDKVKSKSWESSASVAALGKVRTYGMPTGPAWLRVIADGKYTDVHLSPTKVVVAKLHEYGTFAYGGKLPWVGTVEEVKRPVKTAVQPVTMDESEDYDYRIGIAGAKERFTDSKLAEIDHATVAKQVFTDMPKFLDAASANDKSKLPNQSNSLQAALEGTLTADRVTATYQLKEMYYSKGRTGDNTEAKASRQADLKDGPKVEVGNSIVDPEDNAATILDIPAYAKVEKTDVDTLTMRVSGHTPDYGSKSTVILEVRMRYAYRNGAWELANVSLGAASEYALTTKSDNWIVSK